METATLDQVTIQLPAITSITRDKYGALLPETINSQTRKRLQKLFDDVCKSEKVDEHGNWEFGCDFDRKGRGYATNYSFYDVGRDYHSKRLLAIVQIRMFSREGRQAQWPNLRKSYFLIGRNEDDTAFAHPLHYSVINKSLKNNLDMIREAQNWIFDADYRMLLRQGDLAMLPVKRPAGEKQELSNVLLQGSHQLVADEMWKSPNCLYAKNPNLYHLPQTHPDLAQLTGWYKIIVGKRGKFHSFAAPTID